MRTRDADTAAGFLHSCGASRSPNGCLPVRGPDRRPVSPVVVDADLVWVARVPAVPLAAARPSCPGRLLSLSVQLAQDLAVVRGAELAAGWDDNRLVDAAARIVAECLADLPDLPFVGDPFGGEEGTD